MLKFELNVETPKVHQEDILKVTVTRYPNTTFGDTIGIEVEDPEGFDRVLCELRGDRTLCVWKSQLAALGFKLIEY